VPRVSNILGFEVVPEVDSDCCQTVLLLHIASMFHELWKMGLPSR
jgi:hypothetical protein